MADQRCRLALAGFLVLFGLVAGSGKAAADTAVCNGRTATITGSGTINGTAGDDVIIGSDQSDRIWGRGGNDVICSLGGADRVEGGPGNDWIHTGEGDDVAFGQGDTDIVIGDVGSDVLSGGPGSDQLFGWAGDDVIAGGAGDDEVEGGPGDDELFGGADDDLLLGGPGRDVLFGNDGNDQLAGDDGNDHLAGGADSDRIDGGFGHDTLRGGADDDVLHGGAGADQIWGDTGNDWIYGDASDELIGGAGADICDPNREVSIAACDVGFAGAVGAQPPPEPDPEFPPSSEPDPEVEQNTPGFDPEVEQNTPGFDPEVEQNTPGFDPEVEQNTPGLDPEVEQNTPGLDPEVEQNTPGFDPEILPRPESASWFRLGMPIPVADEAELWVSPDGNDDNPGTETQPLESIQLAVDRASPGTTIYLKDGRWQGHGRSGTGWITFGTEDSGEPGRWVRLVAAPGAEPHLSIRQGEAIRVEGAYIEISGLRIEGIDGGPGDPDSVNGSHYGYGILIPHVSPDGATTPAHHVVVTENEVSGFSISGIATDGANWVVVGGNTVHGNSNWSNFGGSGISFLEHSDAGGGGEGKTTGWITNNRVFNNRQLVNSSSIGFDHITDGNCIILDRMDLAPGLGQRTLISENTVSECGGRGINIFESSNVNVRRNLTFHNGQTPSLSGEVYGGGDNILLTENTMVPRPGRQDLVGEGQGDDNWVLDSSTTFADAQEQHRARTGALTP